MWLTRNTQVSASGRGSVFVGTKKNAIPLEGFPDPPPDLVSAMGMGMGMQIANHHNAMDIHLPKRHMPGKADGSKKQFASRAA